jgi:hypothetical protein
VRGIVIVVADLYRPPGAEAVDFAAGAPRGALPGLEHAARFGARAVLARGWREWLADSLGCAHLAGVAPACLAAAAAGAAAQSAATTRAAFEEDARARWIATPVHLTASLASVHLAHRGILRLPRAQQDALAAAFHRAFGTPGFELRPLPSGDFLLSTRGIEPVCTYEPARFAGGDVAGALPQGRAAAALRRLFAEFEMWLHTEPLNEERRRSGELPVTALWPWGAQGRTLPAAPGVARTLPAAFGCDAYLWGLWHLHGAECRALPARPERGPAAHAAGSALWVVTVGGAVQGEGEGTVLDALKSLDARFFSPAIEALRRGSTARVTIVANDTRLVLGRRDALRLWRRPRPALGGFA